MSEHNEFVYEFGPFRLDPAERQLLRDGEVVSLTPKTFDLLVHLVDRYGRLVKRQALMAALWGDTAVEEGNLAYTVSMLRKVLDDGADGASMIQTVPTRGYRFIAPVTRLGHSLEDGEQQPGVRGSRNEVVTTARLPQTSRRTVLAATAFLLGIAGIIATVSTVHPLRRQRVSVPPVLTRLTANAAEIPVVSSQVSRDGRMLAYGDADGVHVQVIDTGETRLLRDTRAMHVYAWSADSTKVRVRRCNTVTCEGWDISVIGEARQPNGATWPAEYGTKASPDGGRILRLADDGVLSADLLNGLPARVVLRGADRVFSATWNIDGTRVLYIPLDQSVVISVPLDGATRRTVFHAQPGQAIEEVLELTGNRLVLVVRRSTPTAVRPTTEFSLQEVPTDGGGRASGGARLPAPWRPEWMGDLSASADGTRLIFQSGSTENHVYVAGFDSQVGLMSHPKRLNRGDWDESVTAWTTDSQAVLFGSNRNGEADIFQQRLDADAAEPIVTSRGNQYRPEPTSDGRWLFYVERGATSTISTNPQVIMRMPLPGGQAEQVALVRGWWGIPRCSYRGRCIAEEIIGDEIVVSALDPVHGRGEELGRWKVGFRGFCIMPDGQSVASVRPAPHENVIRITSLTERKARDVAVRGATFVDMIDPLPDGSGFFSTIEDTFGRRILIRVRLDGTFDVLWSPPGVQPQYAVASPDGSHVGITATTQRTNVWLLSPAER